MAALLVPLMSAVCGPSYFSESWISGYIFCCEVNSAPPGRITANLHIPSLISVTSLLALRAPLSAYIKVLTLCNCKEGGS